MAVDHSRLLIRGDSETIQSLGFVISIWFCAVLCAFFLAGFSGGSPVVGLALDDRVNPNDAPMASLVRLPGIGVSRAAAIVAYRDSFRQDDARGMAFGDCNDLQKVKGIGPKTAESLCEWLKFD
ncbi:MAG TPA: helix-hairpin-helix domain-containing protein [Sedimentisphaerales bacterium]|nr:helix-hairpin-helix domain-containing protein [Sedimentisphaerales bacterium]